jgi:hypothetical protein
VTVTLERPGNIPGRIFTARGRRSLWRHLLCRREGSGAEGKAAAQKGRQRHGRDTGSREGGSTGVGVGKTEAHRAHYGDSESGTVGDET